MWKIFFVTFFTPKDPRPLLDLSSLLSRAPAQFDSDLDAAHWLVLPEEVRFQVDDALSQFESADFQDASASDEEASSSAEMYCLPREFDVLGACLFHRGLLLSSHLPRGDLRDVLLWCRSKKLLRLTRTIPVHQIVAWSEVYLSRNRGRASKGRTFLLVVGLGHQVLATLLETDTGGCAATAVSRPDPFYVDQALNTLDHLEEMGIPLVCERWLTLPNNPAIVAVDDLYQLGGEARQQLPEKGSSSLQMKRTRCC